MTSDDYKRLADRLEQFWRILNTARKGASPTVSVWASDTDLIAEAAKVLRTASVKAGGVVDLSLEECVTCYARDEERCYDGMCVRTGCRIQNAIRPAPTASVGAMQPWPKALNVTRAGYNSWHGDISFAERPTDDELAALHDFLRENHKHSSALAAANQSDGGKRTAPVSCPNCFNEDDCANVDICNAVADVYRPSDTPPAPQAVEAVSVDEVERVIVAWADAEELELTIRQVHALARALLAKFKMEGR